MRYQPQILARVRARLDARARYVRPGSKPYFWGKVLYILVFAYTVGVLLLYLLGQAVQLEHLKQDVADVSQTYLVSIQNSMIFVGIAVGLYIAALVLLLCRFGLTQWILTTGTGVALIFEFYRIYQAANGIRPSFYIRHLAPVALLAVLSTWLCFVLRRDRRAVDRAYHAMVEALYRQYGSGMESLSDDAWEEFLAHYQDPGRPTDKLERRRARAAEKQAAQSGRPAPAPAKSTPAKSAPEESTPEKPVLEEPEPEDFALEEPMLEESAPEEPAE